MGNANSNEQGSGGGSHATASTSNGNHANHHHLAAAAAVRNFIKANVPHSSHHNALGISKAELDERCRPSGLYPKCQWEEKTIRRLIGDGKLAARLRGTEDGRSHHSKDGIMENDDRECPICFLNYAEINVTKCCHANICTECYLQVKPQKSVKQSQHNASAASANPTTKQLLNNTCPFCNSAKLSVTVAGKVVNDATTERGVDKKPPPLESALPKSNGETPNPPESSPNSTTAPSTPNGFGSSLQQNDRVAMMRARSSSMASEASSVGHNAAAATGASPLTNSSTPSHPSSARGTVQQQIAQLAIAPAERHSLEEEMKAQHHHPLTLRLEQEEAERRLRNELEYYQRTAAAASAAASLNSSSHHSSATTTTRRTIRDVRNGTGTPGTATIPAGGGSLNSSSHHGGGRDWYTDVVPTLSMTSSSSGSRGQRRLHDMEAAIMMSMDGRHGVGAGSGGGPGFFLGLRPPGSMGGGGGPTAAMRVMSEEEQIALAIEASLRDSAAVATAAASPAAATAAPTVPTTTTNASAPAASAVEPANETTRQDED